MGKPGQRDTGTRADRLRRDRPAPCVEARREQVGQMMMPKQPRPSPGLPPSEAGIQPHRGLDRHARAHRRGAVAPGGDCAWRSDHRLIVADADRPRKSARSDRERAQRPGTPASSPGIAFTTSPTAACSSTGMQDMRAVGSGRSGQHRRRRRRGSNRSGTRARTACSTTPTTSSRPWIPSTFQREIAITTLNSTARRPSIRTCGASRSTIRYRVLGGWRTYTLTTYISTTHDHDAFDTTGPRRPAASR